jgi:hypothetical protein
MVTININGGYLPAIIFLDYLHKRKVTVRLMSN